jgi:tRNA pseudouridine38-40 synthase
MAKYKLIIEYNGEGYHGMQKQKSLRTVQGALETAVSKFLNEDTVIDFAGRTDCGVHATGQVVHFETHKVFRPEVVKRAINYFLYQDEIAALEVTIASDDFHSRFSAKSRSYVYKILNRKERPTFQKTHFVYPLKLDINAMQEGANFLIGRHDFSSFRAGDCQAKSPIRTLNKLEVFYTKNEFFKKNEEIFIKINAPSFLHQMVRIITGTLLLVGNGKIKPSDIQKILNGKDRKLAGQTAPANGLFLTEVEY